MNNILIPTSVPVTGYAPVMTASSHLLALGGFRKDADGVPPRGRPV